MVTRENYSDTKVTQVLDPTTVTADVNGTGVNTQGFDSLMFAALVGESGDTLSGSVKIELELEESDDDITYTDVADADMTKYVAGTNDGCFAVIDDAAEDDAVYITGYKGSKQYARPVVNVTGTHTNGTPMGIVAIQGHAHGKPVNAST